MASEPGSGVLERLPDFTFGFNNVKFSDRILVIEITNNPETGPHPLDDHDLLDGATDQEAVRLKTIHVNSIILAEKSRFFYKLFSNGMRESDEREVTLRIKASEEVSFMDLLNYMYCNNLPRTSLSVLRDMLVIADKFEVVSCLRYCSQLLQNFPITYESALLYLDLPSSLLMSHIIQPLIDAAKQFVAGYFIEVDRLKEQVLNLPLIGIQTVLSSDGLHVASESVVYDLVLEWACRHYPNLEERREILRTHLLHLIRFPLMTTTKLMEVLTCSDIGPEYTSEIVIRALSFKAETPHGHRRLAAEKGNAASHQFVERAYEFRPVKVVESGLPNQQCTVYFNLKWEEVKLMYPNGLIWSEVFHLGSQEFNLAGKCVLDNQTNVHNFVLPLVTKVADSAAYTVNFQIAVRMKPSEEFMSRMRGNHTSNGGPGCKYLLCIAWTDFIADDSPYFINGILHLRVDLTIK